MRYSPLLFSLVIAISGCSRLEQVGKAPDLSPVEVSSEHHAMTTAALPVTKDPKNSVTRASTWSRGRQSLLGDRRAQQAGDILTVVIEIDDRAELSNSSSRSRNGAETMGLPSLFGIPQNINKVMPDGANMASAVDFSSTSTSSGNGNVKRNEKLKLRVAATVLGTLPNGVLKIQGTQEVRVNFELRELLVTGFVRPEDISRKNEIPYDKIASARISYGGRGLISDVQQPRIGQQVADIILPF
ncbi:flagellar basal body L-ring protein FlgH [Aliiroseovarius crassostreae]|uniref:Flagellar L-ring protein n=1 Tax=Aliiroseovarius crassostreae TaxID=154981 RepID=A0A9Q9HHH4_9RHOB|nr:flagellar basal body L-ring protein FlgH [Aliiroseovarius crassostreae]UWP90740.1 flagellar basal body L-ring protein FlgH [Aliiroseovarius crassostreae]UWP93888.1 flagellar basal body L-ring protein FlgH [Aliiroseovarius crassostreae]UWP97030.1 flagellar basal body L-ring protein FlgH [Aliiroseovarius crassostreae]UWQ00194.1 flagellar basal body L-ring protein FlgH [Aliiroseovarius crassostreae]UWQ03397.1 flagellar basal body L-ring protein FlgH [Aliiroseovarius crassostreae]